MTGTREAPVEAAAQLLDEGGIEAVTLRDVGRLVGVSHNAPYKRFAGKEALPAAIAAPGDLVDDLLEYLRDAADDAMP